ncbi:30S ribosomal protein S3 [Candidatus Woesearchaeota archaeon]|mgnify:CR=1 FL=1|jgi:small subunit ribosomal protein S3|nr:30S ribosomal protein S3 [Candidatus Woesearchaeota archaeon]MBT4248126.1 30S ribosomal protein S3 [Candidatus Woesearchaeota archaeon]
MIEREFIRTKIKNLRIRQRVNEVVSKGAACGDIVIERTPLGEKITINTIRPGLVIGRGGETIKRLTSELKSRYALENPQIEVKEILAPNLVAATVAKRIADEMERFGPRRVKAMGYRSLNNILKSGAMGAEILISGRGIPSQRSRTHRFYGGYLKKCGDIAVSKIDVAIERANLSSGAVGIIVKIMLPDTFIPDRIKVQEADVKMEVTEGVSKELKTAKIETPKAESAKKEAVKPVAKSAETPKKKVAAKKAPAKKPATAKKVAKPATKKATPAKKTVIKKAEPAKKKAPIKKGAKK